MPYKKGYSDKKWFKFKKMEAKREQQHSTSFTDNKENSEQEIMDHGCKPICARSLNLDANTSIQKSPSAASAPMRDQSNTQMNDVLNSTNTCTGDNERRQPLATLVDNVNLTNLAKVIKSIGLPSGWTMVKADDESLKVIYLQARMNDYTKDPTITKSITVSKDNTWTLRVLGRIIKQFDSPGSENLKKYQEIKANEDFLEIVNIVHSAKLCCGNPDIEIPSMAEVRSNSVVEETHEVELENGLCFNSTICSMHCLLLVQSGKNRCSECTKNRNYLRVIKSRQIHQSDKKQHTAVDSHTNYRYLSPEEKNERLQALHAELKSTKRMLKNLEAKLDQAIQKEGHVLDQEMNDYLGNILSNGACLNDELPEGTFRRLFWQQQMEALACKDSRQIRWHPLMVKWCLNIKLRSTSAYRAMRNSGFLKLPSERTLCDYTHWTKMSSGFQPSIFEHLLVEAKFQTLEEWQKFVVLLHDEVKIKSDLVYCKHTGELIGFANLGDINNTLVDFEKQCKDEIHNTPDVATYMLVFMVRGVATRLEYPLAHFPCSGCITADLLFPLLWDGVRYLETIGFKVIASTCDGASTNRKCIKIHKPPKSPKGTVVYKTKNIYSLDERDLFFISDVPHLIKTVRNNWENSAWNKKTRQLWNGGYDISWLHLVNLYKDDLKHCGLRLVPKLKYDHIYLTSYSRMKVCLAAQVLSTSVANALDAFYNKQVKGTVQFVQTFDKFFDCLNTRSLTEATRRRKSNLAPYRSADDPRLKWLKEDFMKYLNDWSKSVDALPNIHPKQKAKMKLSKQTIDGLTMTVNSFVELTKYLLANSRINFILSERFNQDPLESHFGKHRQMKGGNENPTVVQFNYNESSLRLLGSQALAPVTGNTKHGASIEEMIDDTPLPKKPRKQRLA